MSAQTPEQARNEQVIRTLYSLAEAKSKDTPKFVAQFADGGYFYDVAAGKKYFGNDIGVTVDIYATAFPDMHRELYSLHTFDDQVLVEAVLFLTRKAVDPGDPGGGRFPRPERRCTRLAATSSPLKTARSSRFTATSPSPSCWRRALSCESPSGASGTDRRATAMSPAAHDDDHRPDARYYLIFLNGIAGKALSLEVVNLHAAHLKELDDAGKLVLAGPIPERTGGLIVLRVASLAEAKAIAEEDPMIRGAYQTYALGTWLMSNRQNDYRPNIQPEA